MQGLKNIFPSLPMRWDGIVITQFGVIILDEEFFRRTGKAGCTKDKFGS